MLRPGSIIQLNWSVTPIVEWAESLPYGLNTGFLVTNVEDAYMCQSVLVSIAGYPYPITLDMIRYQFNSIDDFARYLSQQEGITLTESNVSQLCYGYPSNFSYVAN